MKLKQGWELFEAVLQAVLDPNFDQLAEYVRAQRTMALLRELDVRSGELFPENQSERLVFMAGEATAKTIHYWLGEIYDFFAYHGGETFIDEFLARHSEWRKGRCDDGKPIVARLQHFITHGLSYDEPKNKVEAL